MKVEKKQDVRAEEGGGDPCAIKGMREKVWPCCRSLEDVSSFGACRGFIVGKVASRLEMPSSLGHYGCGGRFGEVDLGLLKET